jgi:hypothetical protein
MKTRFNLNETLAAQRRIFFVCEYAGETQELDLGDIGAGDSFTLTWEGQTTGAINQSADMAAAIDTALEALSNIEAGDILVTKNSGEQVYKIQFVGTLTNTSIALLSVSATGFTAGGVTRLGVAGAPATGLTFAAADLQVSKNGAGDDNSNGSVTEIGYGRYYYEATQTELNTRGTLSLVSTRTDIAVVFPTIEVVYDVLRSGTAQAGTASTITLDASASSTSDFYLPCTIRILAGTGAGQGPRFATAYNGVTKVLTVTPDWAVTPDSTSEFELYPSLPMASLDEVVDDVSTQVTSDLPGEIISGEGPITVDIGGTVRIAKQRATV